MIKDFSEKGVFSLTVHGEILICIITITLSQIITLLSLELRDPNVMVFQIVISSQAQELQVDLVLLLRNPGH